MKTRSKTFWIILSTLVIGIIIGVLVGGMLQEKRWDRIRGMSHQERFLRVMENIIEPNEGQRDAIREILKRQSERMADIRKRHGIEMMALMDSTREELNNILTDEQLERLEKHMKRRPQRYSRRQIDRFSKVLDLTDDQRKQIDELFDEAGESFRTRGNGSRMDRDERQVLMKRKMDEFISKMNEILTPEQREKFEEMRKHMGPPFDFHFLGPGPPGEPPH
jgi:hypothetical protein